MNLVKRTHYDHILFGIDFHSFLCKMIKNDTTSNSLHVISFVYVRNTINIKLQREQSELGLENKLNHAKVKNTNNLSRYVVFLYKMISMSNQDTMAIYMQTCFP